MVVADSVIVDLSTGPITVRLGKPLSAGGQGTVHELDGMTGYCAKIYRHVDDPEKTQSRIKELMRLNSRAWMLGGEMELALPIASCRQPVGADVCGFVMKQLVWPRKPLAYFTEQSSGLRRAGQVSWELNVALAADLARLVTKLHKGSYIVADLCPDNVFGDFQRGRVILIDADSFQFEAGGSAYHASVAHNEYKRTPWTDSKKQWLTKEHDDFALGVVIAQLLLEGYHPFLGKPIAADARVEDEQIVANIDRRLSWTINPTLLKLHASIPLADAILPHNTMKLLERCFIFPKGRPTANTWFSELRGLGRSLKHCDKNDNHVFSTELEVCPWCARYSLTGTDPFPPPNAGSTGMKSTWVTRGEREARVKTSDESVTEALKGEISAVADGVYGVRREVTSLKGDTADLRRRLNESIDNGRKLKKRLDVAEVELAGVRAASTSLLAASKSTERQLALALDSRVFKAQRVASILLLLLVILIGLRSFNVFPFARSSLGTSTVGSSSAAVRPPVVKTPTTAATHTTAVPVSGFDTLAATLKRSQCINLVVGGTGVPVGRRTSVVNCSAGSASYSFISITGAVKSCTGSDARNYLAVGLTDRRLACLLRVYHVGQCMPATKPVSTPGASVRFNLSVSCASSLSSVVPHLVKISALVTNGKCTVGAKNVGLVNSQKKISACVQSLK